MRKLILPTLISMSLTACAVGPDYERPPIDTPAAWRLDGDQAADLANTAWWRLFRDPVLDRLIQASLEQSKDLRIAAATVEEFRGRFGVTRSAQFPQVDAGASASRRRSPSESLPPGADPVTNAYQVDLGVAFEVDVWGRFRRATEAARADLLASDEAKRTVILTLVTVMASSYVQLRELDKRLEIAQRTLKTREESRRIAQLRFRAGLTSELEAQQAESEYQSAAILIPQVETAIAQQENAISLLLGRNPGAIDRGLTLDDLAMPGIPQGLPSDLLVRRPDIRQAEQNLIAANAQIGVARAAYFPTISLTGLLGSASSDLSNLFSGQARTWQYGGSLVAPIFTAGRIAGQVQAAEAIQQQALANYERTIQTAFSEVENSLIDVRKSREQREAQAKQVAALGRYLRLARLRYDNGYTSYLEVVDAERNLFDAELAMARNQSEVLLAVINLYKAMGGGWVEEAEKLAVPPAPRPVARNP